MAKNYFVTGTDTDCGKTFISCAILHGLAEQGKKTLGLKPIAAGAQMIDGQLKNGDAVELMQFSSVKLPYAQVNPVVFEEAIAPHIAAEKHGRNVTVSQLEGFVRGALFQPADVRIIEGAGGWLVPVNRREPLSLLPKRLKIDVIMVVGMKLGCINHAMLTAQAIANDGLKLVGWVANCLHDDMDVQQENIDTLKQILPAPCWGVVPKLSGDLGNALSGELEDSSTEAELAQAVSVVSAAAQCLNLPE